MKGSNYRHLLKVGKKNNNKSDLFEPIRYTSRYVSKEKKYLYNSKDRKYFTLTILCDISTTFVVVGSSAWLTEFRSNLEHRDIRFLNKHAVLNDIFR